jgi:hypothetical protein
MYSSPGLFGSVTQPVTISATAETRVNVFQRFDMV